MILYALVQRYFVMQISDYTFPVYEGEIAVDENGNVMYDENGNLIITPTEDAYVWVQFDNEIVQPEVGWSCYIETDSEGNEIPVFTPPPPPPEPPLEEVLTSMQKEFTASREDFLKEASLVATDFQVNNKELPQKFKDYWTKAKTEINIIKTFKHPKDFAEFPKVFYYDIKEIINTEGI